MYVAALGDRPLTVDIPGEADKKIFRPPIKLICALESPVDCGSWQPLEPLPQNSVLQYGYWQPVTGTWRGGTEVPNR